VYTGGTLRVDGQFQAWVAKYDGNELAWKVQVPFPPPASENEMHHGTEALSVSEAGVVYAGGSAYRSLTNSVRSRGWLRTYDSEGNELGGWLSETYGRVSGIVATEAVVFTLGRESVEAVDPFDQNLVVRGFLPGDLQ
jgi:hypothetical protein